MRAGWGGEETEPGGEVQMIEVGAEDVSRAEHGFEPTEKETWDGVMPKPEMTIGVPPPVEPEVGEMEVMAGTMSKVVEAQTGVVHPTVATLKENGKPEFGTVARGPEKEQEYEVELEVGPEQDSGDVVPMRNWMALEEDPNPLPETTTVVTPEAERVVVENEAMWGAMTTLQEEQVTGTPPDWMARVADGSATGKVGVVHWIKVLVEEPESTVQVRELMETVVEGT